MFRVVRVKKYAALLCALVIIFCACFGVMAASVTKKSVILPVIMYHTVLQSGSGAYNITPHQLEEDLIELKKQNFTAVFVDDVVNFVKKGGPLPEKPVILSFDDGYYNNYYYAFPLIKKYQSKMVISHIASLSEKAAQQKYGVNHVEYSYLIPSQLKEMYDSGFVEIANHSYNMHSVYPRKGVKKLKSESLDSYKTALTEDINRAQNVIKNACGRAPTVFCYPFGAVSDVTPEIIKSLGFEATLGCEEKLNTITAGDENCLYSLKRFRRRPGMDMVDFLKFMGV